MGAVTLNIWTGAPLLGLWVGSKVAPASGISMLAFLVVAVTIGVTALLLLQLLGVLQEAHTRASGRVAELRADTGRSPSAASGRAAQHAKQCAHGKRGPQLKPRV